MPTKEHLEKYRRAVMARAQAEAEEKIAFAVLTCGLGEGEGQQYEVTITHDQAAKEAQVTRRSVIRWIHNGDLKALPKGASERKYRIPANGSSRWPCTTSGSM
jgi:hypothetical protein